LRQRGGLALFIRPGQVKLVAFIAACPLKRDLLVGEGDCWFQFHRIAP